MRSDLILVAPLLDEQGDIIDADVRRVGRSPPMNECAEPHSIPQPPPWRLRG